MMKKTYYLRLLTTGENKYVPSYTDGFLVDRSLFFHKSGQIWELVGLPKEWSIYAGGTTPLLPGVVRVKIGNFSKRHLETSFPNLLHLRFGPDSKVVAVKRDSNEVIRLRWRRCSLAEIHLREMMEEVGR